MELVKKFSERLGCILRSAIGMEHQSLRSPPLFIGFPKGIHDQSGIRLVRELPRDNLAGEQVAQPGRRGWNEADVRIRTPLRTKAGKSAAAALRSRGGFFRPEAAVPAADFP